MKRRVAQSVLRETALTRVYQPQLALLVKAPPRGGEWLHELKYDGYRIGCLVHRGKITLITRNGNDWTSSFPEVVEAVERLKLAKTLLDGEVAMTLPDGRTSFQALQNAFSGGSRAGLVYFVFDVLRLNGRDLTREPLEARKAALRQVIKPGRSKRIQYSDHVAGDGQPVFDAACRLGLEGIVSKRRDAPYRAKRSPDWVKTKCVARQEFVIGGFTDPEGARQGIGALLVGFYDEAGRLRFAGKVGTGFTQAGAVSLRKRLEAIEQHRPPFDPEPPRALGHRAHWVKPKLVGEVAFAEWTCDGRIRHPSFQGLRTDKAATAVVLERPAATPQPAVPAKGRRVPEKRIRGRKRSNRL